PNPCFRAIMNAKENIMEWFRRSRPAQDALVLANANLEIARGTQDREKALKHCKIAKKELARIDISASTVYLDQIGAAYREYGEVMDRKQNVRPSAPLKTPLPPKTSVTTQPLSPSNTKTVPPTASSTSKTPGRNIELVPATIFATDFPSLVFKGTLPDPDDDLTDTRQLAYYLALLQATPSPEASLDELTRACLEYTKGNEDEQKRLKGIAKDLLLEFMHDGLKDAEATAEIACIAPVLENGDFRWLLAIFVDSLRNSTLLPVHVLEGMDRVIQCATPGSMDPHDLIKIVQHVISCLQDTHIQSLDHAYQLTRTVSRILDAMVDGDFKDLDRVRLRGPLLSYSLLLRNDTDPYLVFQAVYASQALLYISDKEQPWQTILRSTGTAVKGSARLFSAAKSFNVDEFIETVEKGLQFRVRIFERVRMLERVRNMSKDANPLKESGQELREILDTSFDRTHLFYPMLRGIDALLQNGQLVKVKAMICKAPCRREVAFQWGVCQRLGNLAADPMWDAVSQESAVAFLGEIYRNDAVWGQEPIVKQCILDILMQLTSTSSTSGSIKSEFENDTDVRKRTLYDTCQKEGPSSHLWKFTSPPPSSSPLLDRNRQAPTVEVNLRKLARARLEKLDDTLYIAPQAKASRQSADHNSFDLTTKVKLLLNSSKKVLLLWGDSGAGKSTFSKALERELWNDYMWCKDLQLRKEKKIPIFVSLPTIDHLESDFIGSQLYKAHFSDAQIKELKDKRNFVLICDGYDEYRQMCNLYDINQLNRPGHWKAQMMISCRSEHLSRDYRYLFQPKDRDDQMGEALFQEAVIVPFSKEQIQTYIKKHVSMESVHLKFRDAPQWEVNDYMLALDRIPGLWDLVANLFVLALSLRVLPYMVDLKNNLSSVKVTRVTLYDRFVELWAEQGKWRLINGGLVGNVKKPFKIWPDHDDTSQKAILFMKELAVALLENQDGSPAAEYSPHREKDTWKADLFCQDDGKECLHELCPLRRESNQYRFIHPLVLDYALARAVFEPWQKIDDGTKGQETAKSDLDCNSLLFRKSLVDKPAVLQFLAERVVQEPDFKHQLHNFIEHSKTDKEWCIAAANAMTILVRAGVAFNGEDLRGIQIPGADLSGGQFDHAQLQGADLQNVNLGNSWLRYANLSNAHMSGIQLGELPHLKQNTEAYSCAYSPDGRACAVGLEDGTIGVYDTKLWILTHVLHGHHEVVRSVAFSPSGHQIASGSWDLTVRLWDAHTGAPGHTLVGHTRYVNSVAYSPSGHQIASVGDDKAVRLWNAKTGVPGPIFGGHTDFITSVTYSPNGRHIATGSHDKTVRLWDARVQLGDAITKTHGPVLRGHTNVVTSVAYSPSGHQIASASYDKTVRLWDARTGAPVLALSGHTRYVSSVTYSSSGHQIASGSWDKTVRLWDAQSGAPGPILSGHAGSVTSVTYSPSDYQIASGCRDRKVRLWDLPNNASYPILSGHTGAVWSVVYSPSGHQIASGSWDKTVHMWDAKTGSPGPILSGHTDYVTSVAYSPNGRQIASGSDDKTVRLWDAQSGAPGRILNHHTDKVTSVAYSPDGRQIASGSWDMTVRLWDPQQSYASGRVFRGHTGIVTCVTYSPSGLQIASGSADRTVQLSNPENSTIWLTLMGHTGSVNSVAYSPSGHQVASGSHDKTVRLWDPKTGTPGLILSGHTDVVTSVTYTELSNSLQLASGSYDKTVRLWDATSGQCLVVAEDVHQIRSVAWNATLNGIYLATGCGNSVRTWKVIKEADRYQVRLHWHSTHNTFFAKNVLIQNAQRLSEVDTLLLKQHGAVRHISTLRASARQARG
ncbi:WD repeat-containing protein 38, partial [Dissophora globulifera]